MTTTLLKILYLGIILCSIVSSAYCDETDQDLVQKYFELYAKYQDSKHNQDYQKDQFNALIYRQPPPTTAELRAYDREWKRAERETEDLLRQLTQGQLQIAARLSNFIFFHTPPIANLMLNISTEDPCQTQRIFEFVEQNPIFQHYLSQHGTADQLAKYYGAKNKYINDCLTKNPRGETNVDADSIPQRLCSRDKATGRFTLRGLPSSFKIRNVQGVMQIEIGFLLVFQTRQYPSAGNFRSYSAGTPEDNYYRNNPLNGDEDRKIKPREEQSREIFEQTMPCVERFYARQGIRLKIRRVWGRSEVKVIIRGSSTSWGTDREAIEHNNNLMTREKLNRKIYVWDVMDRADASNYPTVIDGGKVLSDNERCALYAHEIAHAFGVPDRYPEPGVCNIRPSEQLAPVNTPPALSSIMNDHRKYPYSTFELRDLKIMLNGLCRGAPAEERRVIIARNAAEEYWERRRLMKFIADDDADKDANKFREENGIAGRLPLLSAQSRALFADGANLTGKLNEGYGHLFDAEETFLEIEKEFDLIDNDATTNRRPHFRKASNLIQASLAHVNKALEKLNHAYTALERLEANPLNEEDYLKGREELRQQLRARIEKYRVLLQNIQSTANSKIGRLNYLRRTRG